MSTAYEIILEETRAASRKFATVQEAYRAGTIGHDEYLAGRAEYVAADRAFDIARGELSPAAPIPNSLTGSVVRHLMRVNKKTIRGIAAEMQITMKRVREVREKGITGPGNVMDWMQYLTGALPTAEQVKDVRRRLAI